MAVLFMDGFTHYATADQMQKWTGGSFPAVISPGNGRFGSGSLRFSGSGASSIYKSLTWGDNLVVYGFAFKTNAVGSANARFIITGALELQLNTAGTLSLKRSGTVLATSTNAISNDVWYHIAVKCVFHASAGTVQLQVNGVDWIPSTGSLNTGSAPGASSFYWENTWGNAYTNDMSDLYVLDGTTTADDTNNDLLGDCKIETLRSTAEGNSAQWVPSTGSDNALTVDESTPNGDTDYNSSTTTGDKDTLVHGDLSTTGGTVHAIQTIIVARKTDAAVRTIAPVIRQGGTDYDGTAVALGTSYVQYRQIYGQDPTSALWSVANVNGDEFGYKLVS